MTIPFFSPIYFDSAPHPLEKCAFLRVTTHFFDLGQEAYTIKHYDKNAPALEVLE